MKEVEEWNVDEAWSLGTPVGALEHRIGDLKHRIGALEHQNYKRVGRV